MKNWDSAHDGGLEIHQDRAGAHVWRDVGASISKLVMKRIIFLILGAAMLHVPSTRAAEQNADVMALFLAVNKDLKKYRRGSLTKALQLEAQEAVRFWPIYEEYERELAKSKLERMTVIADYAKVRKEGTFNDEMARGLIANYFEEQRKQLDALEKYGKQVEQALGSVRAAQFIQVESLNNDLINYGFASNLPLVGSAPPVDSDSPPAEEK